MNENTQHQLRSDVVGYIRDYSFTHDQRYTIPADRLNFWREYFFHLPDEQKKPVATELLAWAFKAHRVIEEQFGESAGNYVSIVEEAVHNTVQIVAALITGTDPTLLLQAMGNAVIESGDSVFAVKDGKFLPATLIPKQSELPALSANQALERMETTVAFSLPRMQEIDIHMQNEIAMFFRLFLIFVIAGFLVVVASVVVALTGHTATGTITLVSGAISKLIAAMFFKKDRELRQDSINHRKEMREFERFRLAYGIIKNIDDQATRSQAEMALIKSLIDMKSVAQT